MKNIVILPADTYVVVNKTVIKDLDRNMKDLYVLSKKRFCVCLSVMDSCSTYRL